MIKLFWVFAGGGAGSLCRYGLSEWLAANRSLFPYHTFWANFISCFILGFLMALAYKSNLPPHLKLLFMTGFCGGFSTFSSFAGETFSLIENGNFTAAFSYVAASLVLCLLSLFLGFRFGNLF